MNIHLPTARAIAKQITEYIHEHNINIDRIHHISVEYDEKRSHNLQINKSLGAWIKFKIWLDNDPKN